MKSLSKVTSVMLALSVAWIAGIVVAGNRDISNFRGTNAFLTQVNFESCTKADRADCAATGRRCPATARAGEDWRQRRAREYSRHRARLQRPND